MNLRASINIDEDLTNYIADIIAKKYKLPRKHLRIKRTSATTFLTYDVSTDNPDNKCTTDHAPCG